jgi:predicted metal-dependent enzyme (double-stranded beta helix superfamily)
LATAVTGDDVPLECGQLRGYTRLLASEWYEAWLVAWAPSGALDLHDHGGSAGAVHVLRGELSELYTDLVDRHPLRPRTVGAGHDLLLPPTRVHEVWNAGPAVALSVHVYAPPISTMTFFDRNLVPTSTVPVPVADG